MKKTLKRTICIILTLITLTSAFTWESAAARKRTVSESERKFLSAFGLEYDAGTGVMRNKKGKGMVFGFDRDGEQRIWISSNNAWQRNFGYSTFYDDMAPLFNMDYETLRFYFNYGGKDWLVQVWKGKYGWTSGAEMGVYNKPANRKIKHYDAAIDADRLTMGFTLYDDQGRQIFTRKESKSWWCTGFVLFMRRYSHQLGMKFTINFNNYAMLNAFRRSITKDMRIRCTTYGTRATIWWDM